MYTNKWMQLFVATMILGNFFVNIAEKEIDPFPPELQAYGEYWENFDKAPLLGIEPWQGGSPYHVTPESCHWKQR